MLKGGGVLSIHPLKWGHEKFYPVLRGGGAQKVSDFVQTKTQICPFYFL